MFKVDNKDTTNIYMISTKRYLFVVYDVFDKASKSVIQTVEQGIHWHHPWYLYY